MTDEPSAEAAPETAARQTIEHLLNGRIAPHTVKDLGHAVRRATEDAATARAARSGQSEPWRMPGGVYGASEARETGGASKALADRVYASSIVFLNLVRELDEQGIEFPSPEAKADWLRQQS